MIRHGSQDTDAKNGVPTDRLPIVGTRFFASVYEIPLKRSLKRSVAPLLFFALLACLAMYWLLFNLSTSMIWNGVGVTDYFHFHWNYWWIRHALTTPGLNVYETNYVMTPFTNNLAFHTLTPLWYPIWALVEPLSNTFVAMAAIFIVAFTLTGWVFFVLLRHEGAAPGLALVGGTILELSPLMYNSLHWTMVSLLGWFWLPGLLYLWGRLAETNRRPGKSLFQRPLFWTIFLALALWGMVLTDIQYPLFVAFLIVPYGLWTLWQAGAWSARIRLAAFGTAALAAVLVLLWFIGPLRYILSFDRSVLSPTPMESAVGIDFPCGYVGHCFPGVPIGYVVIPAALIALLISRVARCSSAFPRRRWFWLALVPAPLLLSPGPSITVGGTQITMPYVLLHRVFGGMFRYPERFGPVFVVPLVLFTMLTLTPVIKDSTQRRKEAKAQRVSTTGLRLLLTSGFFLIVVADTGLLTPVPIEPQPRQYAFYQDMGREPYDYAIIEAPTGGASGEGLVGDPRAVAMQFYGMTHGKRMVNGHISRVDISHFWYLRTDDPLLSWLGQRRPLDPSLVEPELRKIIADWPVGYIVIHTDLIEQNTPTLQEIVGYFNSLDDLLCPYTVEGDAIVYRTRWHPDGCPPRTPPEVQPGVYQVDIGSPDDVRYIGWGWHWAESISGLTMRWTGQYPQTQLYVDLPPGEYQVSVSAQAFWQPRTLRLEVNGVPLDGSAQVTTDTLQTFTFTAPASAIGSAAIGGSQHVTLTLDYDGWVVPAEVGQSGDPRKLAVMVDWIRFTRSSS